MSTGTKVDYLPVDPPISGQRFVLMSFLSPEGIRNCTTRGIQIRGVFDTEEASRKHAEFLVQHYKDNNLPLIDIHIGEMGAWCPWDPDPNSAKDQVYQEKELQELMKAKQENERKAKQFETERKHELIKKEASKNHSNESVRERLRQKIAQKQAKTPNADDNEKDDTNNLPKDAVDENLDKMKQFVK